MAVLPWLSVASTLAPLASSALITSMRLKPTAMPRGDTPRSFGSSTSLPSSTSLFSASTSPALAAACRVVGGPAGALGSAPAAAPCGPGGLRPMARILALILPISSVSSQYLANACGPFASTSSNTGLRSSSSLSAANFSAISGLCMGACAAFCMLRKAEAREGFFRICCAWLWNFLASSGFCLRYSSRAWACTGGMPGGIFTGILVPSSSSISLASAIGRWAGFLLAAVTRFPPALRAGSTGAIVDPSRFEVIG
mmetsp:Transcript_37337/g.94163  ORF Transcript_37337/g.94163 Transcript_37337/m.94163 type:complete len:255 (-) Transcript_37337:32-796(-)